MSGDLAITDSLCWEKLYAEPFDLNLRAAVCVDLAKKNSIKRSLNRTTTKPHNCTSHGSPGKPNCSNPYNEIHLYNFLDLQF